MASELGCLVLDSRLEKRGTHGDSLGRLLRRGGVFEPAIVQERTMRLVDLACEVGLGLAPSIAREDASA